MDSNVHIQNKIPDHGMNGLDRSEPSWRNSKEFIDNGGYIRSTEGNKSVYKVDGEYIIYWKNTVWKKTENWDTVMIEFNAMKR